MAAFIAKQLVGNQLSAVKGDIGHANENLSSDERAKIEEEERERLLAIQEAEEMRKAKHRKLEEEREKMRSAVRQKYNIKRKEDNDLRRQQEAQMAASIAAMNPRNSSDNRLKPGTNSGSSNSNNNCHDDDFTTKLLNGNVVGAANHLVCKVQSLIPQNFSLFKKD